MLNSFLERQANNLPHRRGVHLETSFPRGVHYVTDRMRLRGLSLERVAELAAAGGADGVQLGHRGLPVAAARRAAGSRLRIGRSVHSVAEAAMAERDGADFLLLGTLFATESHPEATPAGPGLVSVTRAAVRIPVIGIGGITAANADAVMAAGAKGVAVIGAIQSAVDVEAAAREIVRVVARRWVDHAGRV